MESTENTKRDQVLQRKQKLAQLREAGFNYPNDVKPTTSTQEVFDKFHGMTKEQVESTAEPVVMAGRIMTRRLMGKASFTHFQDRAGRLQAYCRMQDLGEQQYQVFLDYDIGDIVMFAGKPFLTNKGELSLYVTETKLLSKSLHPLPDKFHGLHDIELCYRQRYLDIMVNENSRERFLARAQIIRNLRNYLEKEDFVEVETPMMQPKATGANAKPFITHHNTLDMQLFMRVAPELYLKRLIVGGLERVFEINRNFRNEGVSTRHNPEFTMVEFYQAFADFSDMMELTEALLRHVGMLCSQDSKSKYQDFIIDWAKPFLKMTMVEAISNYVDEAKSLNISDRTACIELARKINISLEEHDEIGQIQLKIFEQEVEHRLLEPTFITHYPTVVSPLARRSEHDPEVTDRFELFIHGKEIANGFSELNDPEDQASRFQQQLLAKERGDDEAMPFDQDYITALEYAMPPTGGVGVGIDRLVMLLTDAASIRDVILFPLLKSQS
ncbi:MAG: lysine--tRNA ligase [Pseudomonadota bacterium]|nr:lysine--tRNA ligase [Pseudomonadota bacterium]